MDANQEKQRFILSNAEATLIDGDQMRLERPFSDANQIFSAAAKVVDLYVDFEPAALYPAGANRSEALAMKYRAEKMAREIMKNVASHTTLDISEFEEFLSSTTEEQL